MRIRILSISHKIPTWVKTGYEEYAKRLPKTWVLELIDIPAPKGGTATPTVTKNKEGERLLAAMKAKHRVIALDEHGENWSTQQLAQHLQQWQLQAQPIDLLIGGAEGLSPACLAKAERTWSLSALTFPHALVRIIVAEQIYRAWSLLNNHPYHRG